MIPSAREIMVQRYLFAGYIRLASLLFFALALWPIFSWLLEGIRDFDLFDLYWYWPRLLVAFVLATVGVVLLMFRNPLARWCLPISTQPVRCPQCGFRLHGLREPRCPECGLELPDEIVKTPPIPSSPAAATGVARDG